MRSFEWMSNYIADTMTHTWPEFCIKKGKNAVSD
jgi:hypothetical protein